ncbi:hypothetical protein M2266_002621 [Streptomyces sp. SPB162]|nr:hypothetical protein [Streptomyces sp. SPB162]
MERANPLEVGTCPSRSRLTTGATPSRRRPHGACARRSCSSSPPRPLADEEHFFDLESLDDPRQLLARSTELALAFRAAADRATEYQAIAAAQLADPRRFDRLTFAAIAEQSGWTEDYAKKMVEFGTRLQER